MSIGAIDSSGVGWTNTEDHDDHSPMQKRVSGREVIFFSLLMFGNTRGPRRSHLLPIRTVFFLFIYRAMKHEKDETDETIIRVEELIGNEWVLEREPIEEFPATTGSHSTGVRKQERSKNKYGIVRTTI